MDIGGWKHSVGPGWHPLLDELHAELVQVDPDYEIFQVKEKFGTLRFYVGPVTEEAHEIIRKYERKSGTVCEDCGSPGEVRMSRTWLRTLCDKCEAGRMVQSPRR